MPIYQIDGLTPVVPEESYVHPTAVLIWIHPEHYVQGMLLHLLSAWIYFIRWMNYPNSCIFLLL